MHSKLGNHITVETPQITRILMSQTKGFFQEYTPEGVSNFIEEEANMAGMMSKGYTI
jgi:hypothetical protein